MDRKEFLLFVIIGMLIVLGAGVYDTKQEVRQLRCDLVETEVAITTQLDSLQVKIDKPVWWR